MAKRRSPAITCGFFLIQEGLRADLRPISPVAGYRMIEYFGTNLPSGADIIQALQPEPDRLGAWLPVPLASKKTAQARHHPNGFAETGRLRRRNRILTDETDQRFPFEFLEIHRAGHLRGFSSE